MKLRHQLHSFAEQMQEDDVLGGMLNPKHLEATTEPAIYFRSRFPVMMTLLEAHRGLIEFEDRKSQEELLNVMTPAIGAYERVARHLLRLQHTWHNSVVTSVIEQPC